MNVIHKSAWIHIEERKALFLRGRDQDTFYSPGGKREEGETDEEALIREVKEEVTVDLLPKSIKEVLFFVAKAHDQPVPTKLIMKCYTADFSGTISASSEIEEITWYTAKDAGDTSEAGAKILNWLKEQDLID